VSTLSQTMHVEMKSPWLDMPLHQMPRFDVPDKHIFYAQLPKHSNSSAYRVDPRHDVKVALTFMGSRLSIPWVTLFNAREKVTLKVLVVTFTHDEFEVVRLRYDTVYSPRIKRVDSTHPTLRGFEIEYRWESVQEDDFGMGVTVLFVSALMGFSLLFGMILCHGETVDGPTRPKASSRYKK